MPEYFRTGFGQDVPYQLVKKNRELIDVLLSATAERDESGNLVRSLAVLTDVTERKRAEAELRQYRDRLEELVAERTAELIRGKLAIA